MFFLRVGLLIFLCPFSAKPVFLNLAHPAVPFLSLCLVWLSAEWPCQGDILSHHVLTHLQPGLVKAFAAQFSGAEASRVLFYCFNPPVSYFLVCRSYSPNGLNSTAVYLYKYRFTFMSVNREVRSF